MADYSRILAIHWLQKDNQAAWKIVTSIHDETLKAAQRFLNVEKSTNIPLIHVIGALSLNTANIVTAAK